MFKKSYSLSNQKNQNILSNETSEEIECSLANRFKTAIALNKELSTVIITPNDILKLTKPTVDYLCPKSANIYNIEFFKFRVRDFSNSSNNNFKNNQGPSNPEAINKMSTLYRPVLIDIQKPIDYVESEEEKNDPSSGRFVRYHLHNEFLNLKSLGAQITFSVGGNRVVNKFRMIERHYFKNKLMKCFDFNFGAALIPNSENSIEHIYEMPKLNDKVKKDMINSPWETKSDSFYFVENRLIMHNKAEYAYNYDG